MNDYANPDRPEKRQISMQEAIGVGWCYGWPMLDDPMLDYGTFYALFSQRVIVRGQRVPTMDEVTPELIVRHKLFREMWYIGEKVETPAMKRALAKHKHRVIRIEKMDGNDIIKVRDES